MGLLRIWVTLLKTPCANFWGREWNLLDIATAGIFLSVHVLCLFAPFYFTWTAFWLAIVLFFVTGFGVTLSYHRNLAHRSFRLPKLLEYLFAYCGVLSVQGSPTEWVSTHRYHHQFTDTEKDAHSPLKGFWFSHMGWILDSRSRFGRYGGLRNVEDINKQPFYVFLHHTVLVHPFLLGCILYYIGGFPFVVWPMTSVELQAQSRDEISVSRTLRHGTPAISQKTFGGWGWLHLVKDGTITTMLLNTQLDMASNGGRLT
ncbi:delta-9 acyl-lipid desaturase 2-like isoform X3 [Malus sylvestris]|uniref:delta-9 acyl-lipid desaturase 2-like isoform X3 n=1 Tax=Malus sylvestris TaxID=3752 RepID=UPI0021AC1B9C|nr:delta-9 acyl-lipid desaturase 2-like isoform X3 [Malus sylvestris]